MARGVNKVILIGNLGADPDMRYLPSGAAVTNFSIACTETWKDKETGEQKENTTWIDIESWGRLAEICSEYLRKGSQVFIEGKLKQDRWEDKDTGKPRYKMKVRADQMQMMGGGSGKPPMSRDEPPQSQPEQPQQEFDDDIPF